MPRKPLRVWLAATLPVVAYAALIVAVSSQSKLPKAPFNDKLMHFGEYAVLGFLLARAIWLRWDRGLRHAGIFSILAATAFGITDEIHQYFVPNRDADVLDVVADFAGSLAGSVAWALLALEVQVRTTRERSI